MPCDVSYKAIWKTSFTQFFRQSFWYSATGFHTIQGKLKSMDPQLLDFIGETCAPPTMDLLVWQNRLGVRF